MTRPRPRYHWTCEHAAVGIRIDGHVGVNLGRSWWTDLDAPGGRTRAAAALTSHSLGCDRMRYRCRAADASLLIPWIEHRAGLPALFVAELEAAPGCRPDRWWVALGPVPVSSVRRVTA